MVSLEFYKLDPSYYLSSPGLSWDEMLKMIEIKLELISDIDKHYIFLKMIRIRNFLQRFSKRISKANNKYIKNYDSTKEIKHKIDLVANNLYGWSMSQYLPYGEFKWIKNDDIFDTNSIAKNSIYSNILEVGLEYPDELHILHNDYLLAPEKPKMTYDMLSNYCKKCQ